MEMATDLTPAAAAALAASPWSCTKDNTR
jgi:hypothetical protein